MSSRDSSSYIFFFFFFNDTATTEIYTLSLHDALPISIFLKSLSSSGLSKSTYCGFCQSGRKPGRAGTPSARSEEHTSELQSRRDLVCRLLLEKKKKNKTTLTAAKATNTY